MNGVEQEKFLYKYRQYTLSYLQQNCAINNVENLSSFSNLVDDTLKRLILDIISKNLGLYFENDSKIIDACIWVSNIRELYKKNVNLDNNIVHRGVDTTQPYLKIKHGAKRYSISFNIQNIIIPSELSIYIIEQSTSLNKESISKYSESIRHPGQYKLIKIMAHKIIDLKIDNIISLAKSVFETGYAWYDENVRALITKLEPELGRDLYSYLRLIFQNHMLYDYIWFGMSDGINAYYIADEISCSRTIEIASKQRSSLHFSIFDLISSLLTDYIPFEIANAKIGHNSGRSVDINLLDSKYKDKEVFINAQRSLFGTTNITVQPILSEGNALLVAFYPTKLKNKIESVIESQKKSFASIVLNDLKPFKQLNKLRTTDIILPEEKSLKNISFFEKIANFCLDDEN